MGTPLLSPQFALFPLISFLRAFSPSGISHGGCRMRSAVLKGLRWGRWRVRGHVTPLPFPDPPAQPRGAGSQGVTPVLLVGAGTSQTRAGPKDKW